MRTAILTSIAPAHNAGDVQQRAVRSWMDAGHRVYSFNCSDEIELLHKEYPCSFVECKEAERMPYHKRYAPLNALLNFARDREYDAVLLLNSDIEVREDGPWKLSQLFELCKHGLVYSSRKDHDGDPKTAQVYKHGFDAFFLHKNFLHVLPDSLFVLGQTWWDYWVPYRFVASSVPIASPKDPPFYHLRHPVQYDRVQWHRMTEHFRFMENLKGAGTNAQHTTNQTHMRITRATTWI